MDFDFPREIVEEGLASIEIPKLKKHAMQTSDSAPSKAPVFYNPTMALNRDIAVLVLQAYQRTKGRQLSVCEPLAGCGIRGIRFAKEVEGIKEVVVNDISIKAAKLSKLNFVRNELARCMIVMNEDANFLLSRHSRPRRRFDFIDVDPFGSPVPYLDSAIRALRDGGILALTATDLAPLCGVHSRACVRKYGGKSLRTEYCKELAVRILIGCLATSAAKHNIGIKTVFSHSTDHYIRAYSICNYGARNADWSIQQMGYILHCFDCFHREISKGLFCFLSPECPECNSNLKVAGPLWLGKLISNSFLDLLKRETEGRKLERRTRIVRLLSVSQAEADSTITYYVTDKVCDKLGLPVPPLTEVITELKMAGFEATKTHFNHKGVKTTASAKEFKETLSRILKQSI